MEIYSIESGGWKGDKMTDVVYGELDSSGG